MCNEIGDNVKVKTVGMMGTRVVSIGILFFDCIFSWESQKWEVSTLETVQPQHLDRPYSPRTDRLGFVLFFPHFGVSSCFYALTIFGSYHMFKFNHLCTFSTFNFKPISIICMDRSMIKTL